MHTERIFFFKKSRGHQRTKMPGENTLMGEIVQEKNQRAIYHGTTQRLDL
jgi:hypothetical protein